MDVWVARKKVVVNNLELRRDREDREAECASERVWRRECFQDGDMSE